MAVKRTIRTPEQRLADAKNEIIKIQEQTEKQALDLREQARGWFVRASELDSKAHGALEKADGLLRNIGLDPEEFWTAHPEGSIDPAIIPAMG